MRRLFMIGALGAGLALAACAPIKPSAPPASEPVRVYQWYTYVYNETGGTQSFETECVDKAGNVVDWYGTLPAGEWEYYNWTYGGQTEPRHRRGDCDRPGDASPGDVRDEVRGRRPVRLRELHAPRC